MRWWGWRCELLLLAGCFLIDAVLRYIVGVESRWLRVVTAVLIAIIALRYIDGRRERRAA